MPDLDETSEKLRHFLLARVPVVIIHTMEPGRAREAVQRVVAEHRTMAYYEHSRTEGLKDLHTGATVDDDPSLVSALEYARKTFKAREYANFLFTDIEDLENESTTARHLREMVRLAETRLGSIVIVSEKAVWAGLRRLGMSVTLDLPTQAELVASLNSLIDVQRGGSLDIRWEYDDVQQAAEVLAGVSVIEAENVLATLMARGRLWREDIQELSNFKDQIFGEVSGVERIRLHEDYKVGGLYNLRGWLDKRAPLMRGDYTNRRVPPPKGVLLVGVPGCGKSLSAKAIAHDWGLPLYRLDMSGILGMYVGQSESQLREALAGAERVAPCVLWIDEIEKALASGVGDSGTSRRLVGQFLFWLQESTAKVFLVATANDVSSLPPELLRKGRFDEMFFVDLPEADEREEIIRMYFMKYLDADISPVLMADLVTATEGFSGSDIDATVREVATTMDAERTSTIPADHEIREFFANVVPYSRTNPEDVAAIRSWGLGRCVPAGSKAANQPVSTGSAPRRVIAL